ncbi:hypothetical protein M5X00_21705 [Paenibacillus alvei]|nr:hypothetical protein [Paenibacillus alvei]MCY9756862.1 hypothetical protein [Paenibacillus alvei]
MDAGARTDGSGCWDGIIQISIFDLKMKKGFLRHALLFWALMGTGLHEA